MIALSLAPWSHVVGQGCRIERKHAVEEKLVARSLKLLPCEGRVTAAFDHWAMPAFPASAAPSAAAALLFFLVERSLFGVRGRVLMLTHTFLRKKRHRLCATHPTNPKTFGPHNHLIQSHSYVENRGDWRL